MEQPPTPYPLTLEHVKAYLATKGEDESLGLCHNAMGCLLANVLNWQYPQAAPWRVDVGSYAAVGASHIETARPLEYLRAVFDIWTPRRSLTKGQLRARLHGLAACQDGLPEEQRMPFVVSDLFPEPVA